MCDALEHMKNASMYLIYSSLEIGYNTVIISEIVKGRFCWPFGKKKQVDCSSLFLSCNL
jgi:hypothetical protein